MNPVLTFTDADQLAWLFNTRPRVVAHVAAYAWAQFFPSELREYVASRDTDVDFAIADGRALGRALAIDDPRYGDTLFVGNGEVVASYRPPPPEADFGELIKLLYDSDYAQAKQRRKAVAELAAWDSCVTKLLPSGAAVVSEDWETANVSTFANYNEVKRAYRRFARDFHPDRLPELPEAARAVLREEYHRRREAFERLLAALQNAA